MNAIGILDSGLGGYTIFNALHHAYPNASFVFLADQANAPYGDKSREEIRSIAIDAIAWFEAQGIFEVVVACNTISAQVLPEIKLLFPAMTLTGIIELTAHQNAVLNAQRVAVIATTGTIRTNAYPTTITAMNPSSTVEGIACPRLVPLIEGLAEPHELETYLEPIIAPLKAEVLVLACTHYPLAAPTLQRYFKGILVDSIEPIVALFSHRVLPSGKCRVYTTQNPDYLKHQIKVLFESSVEVALTSVPHANRLSQ
jgi:glutamate racemase